jgi:arsenite methyltransferase
MTSIPDVKLLEDAIADRYGLLSASRDSLSCGRALELGAPRLGEAVVDLGCGRGKDVFEAARRVGEHGTAIGIDLSADMIAAARAAAPPGLGNVAFVRSDLGALELADESVDLVLSNCAINHAPDKAAVYREVHRVLRPGGRFVISDIVAEKKLPESVRRDPGAWAACFGGALLEDEVLAAACGAGFGEVTVLQRSEPYRKEGFLLRSITIRGVRAAREG